MGTIALFISFVRVVLNHFTNKHHFGFESAIWYWHFVDVVWLFLFISVYWWSNSGEQIIKTSVDGIPIPSSISKLTALQWLYEFGPLLAPLFIKAEFCLILFSVVTYLSLSYFFRNAFLDILYKILCISKELPFYRRQSLIVFTLFFAIPNKILINNGIKGLTLFVLTLILFSIGYFYEPLIYIFYVMYLVLLCESWLFAIFYESRTSFTKLVNKFLFNTLQEETPFSREYFTFFWGNMNKAAQEGDKIALAAGGAAIVAINQRNEEKKIVEEQAANATNRDIEVDKANGTVKSPEEYQESYKKHVQEAVDDTVVLKAEREVKAAFSSKPKAEPDNKPDASSDSAVDAGTDEATESASSWFSGFW